MADATSRDVYQLKISVKGDYKPPIWRRILISKDSNFKELHYAIQNAMDWSNTQLHKFRPRSKVRSLPRYDDSDKEFEIGTIYEGENLEKFGSYYCVKKLDESKTKLSDYFKTLKDLIEYVYGFDVGWELEIRLENILPPKKFEFEAVCVGGKRAAPPEPGLLEDDSWKNKAFDLKSGKFPRFEDKVLAVDPSIDIYQLRISIKYHKPPIWRRIHIPSNSTFKDLHNAIQIVMNWSNTHLHKFGPPRSRVRHLEECEEFEIGTIRGERVQESWMPKKYDETKTKLCDYFEEPKDTIDYDYDFGSTWEHVIVLEKILPPIPGKVYPICVTGKRARPPEHDPVNSDDDDDDWKDEDFDLKSVDFSRMKH